MDDDIEVLRLSELRVMAINSKPGTAVLKIRSGQHVMHYALAVDDLAALGKRLSDDARLLKA
jgi:hypothetical protein